jgi:hypothetical protein
MLRYCLFIHNVFHFSIFFCWLEWCGMRICIRLFQLKWKKIRLNNEKWKNLNEKQFFFVFVIERWIEGVRFFILYSRFTSTHHLSSNRVPIFPSFHYPTINLVQKFYQSSSPINSVPNFSKYPQPQEKARTVTLFTIECKHLDIGSRRKRTCFFDFFRRFFRPQKDHKILMGGLILRNKPES